MGLNCILKFSHIRYYKIVERVRDESHSILIKVERVILDVTYKYKHLPNVVITEVQVLNGSSY